MAVLKYWDETLSQWLPVAPGPKGDKGDKGDTGDLANLDIGTVTTGSPAAAHIDGNFEDGYELDLTLPSVGAGSIHNEDINAAADIDRTKIAGTALTTESMSIFNVKDYGAVGDGTADDTAAVQAAIDAAEVVGGGTVYLSGGIYKLSAALTITDGIILAGAGKSPSSALPTDLNFTHNGRCIIIDSGSDIVIRDMYIHSAATTDDVVAVKGSSRRITLERLIVNGTGTTGVGVYLGADAGWVIESTVHQMSVVDCGTGIRVSEACTSIGIRDCYANANSSAGYDIRGTYCALESCASDTNGLYGYLIQSAVSITLNGCGAEVSGRSALNFVDASQVTVTGFRSHANNTTESWPNVSFVRIGGTSTKITLIGCTDSAAPSGTTYSINTTDETPIAGTMTLINCTLAKGVHSSVAPSVDLNTTTDGMTLRLGTSTGSKIGTATDQKLGFWGAIPVTQPVANADTSGASLGDLETEVNQLKALLRTIGLMAS